MTSLCMQQDVSLRDKNTLGLPARAERYVEITEAGQLFDLERSLAQKSTPLLVLGGGSNLVLDDQVPGVVARVGIKGWQVLLDEPNTLLLKVGAGENWHQTVERTLREGYFGLENLALIPGTVGAAPMQNIGAYGVELKDRLHSVEVFDRESKQLRTFSCADCLFGYRDSRFKSVEPDRYIITAVVLRLSKVPDLQLEYGGLRSELAGLQDPTPQDVFDAVSRVRRSKLPDPEVLGNAGSFFKNPVVDQKVFIEIRDVYPDLVAFPEQEGRWKLAAGWLIDRAGLKGAREGEVGTYEKQALVLVNLGNAHRVDVEAFAAHVSREVKERFGVELEPEPRFYP